MLRRIPATLLLLFAIAICFVLELLTGIDDGPLVQLGVNYGPAVRAGQYWRLVTCMFLHADFVHIGFNAVGLFQLGGLFESWLGSWRLLAVYFATGIAGSLVSAGLSEHASLGASGAIFGILGALVGFLLRRRGSLTPEGKSILMQLLFWAALNVYFGFTEPRIDNYGHLGGCAAGLLIGAILPEPRGPAEDAGLRNPPVTV
jgi:rhomboid protease GluP